MKHAKYILLFSLCLLLAACGPKPAENLPEVSVSEPPAISEPEVSTPDISEPDASAPDSSEAEAPVPLTQEELAAAHQAAMDYYAGTVFEVETLTEIEPRQGEITFRVSCSKGGVKVDPDRTISLERKNGTWSVVSEGY